MNISVEDLIFVTHIWIIQVNSAYLHNVYEHKMHTVVLESAESVENKKKKKKGNQFIWKWLPTIIIIEMTIWYWRTFYNLLYIICNHVIIFKKMKRD